MVKQISKIQFRAGFPANSERKTIPQPPELLSRVGIVHLSDCLYGLQKGYAMVSPARDKLSRDGFLVAREYLSAELLDALRTICRDVLDGMPRERFSASGGCYNIGEYPIFADIVALPDTAKVVKELGFSSFKWGAGHLTSRPGYSPPQFWQQDWWGWSNGVSYHEKPLGLSFVYNLSDIEPKSGCLRVIPGSHRVWHELHSLPVVQDKKQSWSDYRENIASRSHTDEVALNVNAGDLVIMDNRLLHSAYANTGNEERNLLTLLYLPEFERMPASIQHRCSNIFSRTDRDGDPQEIQPKSPLDWPEEKRAIVRHLFPHVSTAMPEEPTYRKPARVRMQER